MQVAVLRSFLGVASQGSVRKGAEEVNITPSAVSRHIAILERVVGAPLFDRRSRGMVLTPEGEILRTHALRTMSTFDVVRPAMAEIRGLRRGAVRVCAIEAVTSSLLNPAIRDYLSQHAGISFEVEVVQRDNNDVVHALLRDGADIGIMYKLGINSDIEVLAELEAPFVAVMSSGHELAGREKLCARDLAGYRMAALHPSSATRRLTDEAFRTANVPLDYTLVVNSYEMAKEFARTGVGITILPQMAVRSECAAGSLVTVPLTDWTFNRVRATICAHRDRPLAHAARSFLDLLKLRSKTN
jgi:DNA-binding transcriptional LysR family regulator